MISLDFDWQTNYPDYRKPISTAAINNHIHNLRAEETKGRRDRTVFFSPKTEKALRRWLQFKDCNCEMNANTCEGSNSYANTAKISFCSP